ncbi:MAG: GH3 auxin-responsive promoter family protein [Culturomica sp.]|jgi:hypothetical protein|nr:GH3 auxin-responsive promoter family protein [Culturomica sp.]
MSLTNFFILQAGSKRFLQIEHFKKEPLQVQRDMLKMLLKSASETEYGKRYHFNSILTPEQYRQRLPVVGYDEIKDYIIRTMTGEQNLLWNENIEWFAKSSGTTSDKSKFIPVSNKILKEGQFRGGKDAIGIFTKLYPDNAVFKGKTLALGGSSEIYKKNTSCRFGDLSAIMISNTPRWANLKKVPDSSVMLMSNWEEKIEKIIEKTLNEDVRCLMGVPSWFLSLINKILEKTGKQNLHEVWSNLELFIHGGVSFTPYREQYKRLLPDPKMKYMETYNASEGFFGLQDDPHDPSMLLMLDYGVYYEFMPMGELGKQHPNTLLLEEVETNVNYALIISTTGGLWRYMIGDTIMFTSVKPYKFRITGRTKLFINAFGEELIIDNANEAITAASKRTGSEVFEFTAAPIFMEDGKKGAHEWIVEFKVPPADYEEFADILDEELQRVNSDYEAKRVLSLNRLKLNVARKELFNDWMRINGKLGGQHKVPKLWNDRTHIEQLLKLNAQL